MSADQTGEIRTAVKADVFVPDDTGKLVPSTMTLVPGTLFHTAKTAPSTTTK